MQYYKVTAQFQSIILLVLKMKKFSADKKIAAAA